MLQKIIEIKHFREALKAIHYNTWFILDLDNTVMISKRELGGDAWFNALFDHLAHKKINKQTALPWIMSVYNTAQYFIRTIPVESKINLIIKELQDIGVPVLALTARGYAIRHQTIRQLADIGIDFSRNSAVPNDDHLCSGGIIFCDGKNKGETLNLFFSNLKKLPQHISMVDDKKKHLEHVMLTLKSLNISFSGFRYGYLDEQVNQFNMERANIQLAHLWQWLSSSVQNDIKNLQLIPEPLQGTLSPSEYADSFFPPDLPLPSTRENKVQDSEKRSQRSRSALSFFQKELISTSEKSLSPLLESNSSFK